MATPWDTPISSREEGYDIEVLSYASQFLDGQHALRNQQTVLGQLPWLGATQGAGVETSSESEAYSVDYIHGGCFDLPFHPAPCDSSCWNFGLDMKPSLPSPQTEISISDYDQCNLSIGSFDIGTDAPAENKYDPEIYSSSKFSGKSLEFNSPTGLQSHRRFFNQGLTTQNEYPTVSDVFLDSSHQQSAAEYGWVTNVGQSPEYKFSPMSSASDRTDRILESVTSDAGDNSRSALARNISVEASVTSISDSRRSMSTTPLSFNPRPEEISASSKRPASFDSCVSIFETTPGAMTKVKRRKKLDPTSHKSFKVTRKIGACLECRFRKRPCNPGTPCQYCIKVFESPSIAQVTCHRESPFSGAYCATDYFILSSKKRIIDFNLKGKEFGPVKAGNFFTIDGKSGPRCLSLRLKLPISWHALESLNLEDQAEVWRTRQRPPDGQSSKQCIPGYVSMIPEDDETLGKTLEEWAIRYSSKFSRLHYKRYPTAFAYNVGTLYIEKKLPEYELVALLLRGVALSYVLRAGVQCPASEFQTIQARIDTVLYRRLRSVESNLWAALQKIIWVSSGRLKREQLYPVAYVMWQTMRSTCLRASHLETLLNKSKGSKSSSYLRDVHSLVHCFNLLLATHTALFHSNSPIIMDFTDPANQDLLRGDEELIREAMKLRQIILDFQEHSLSRPFKSSNWYKDTMYGRFRNVLNGRGIA